MMDFGEQLSRLEGRLRGWVAERVAAIVQWSPIGSTDAKRGGYRLDGRPTSQRYSRAARSVQHAGFQSRPLANTNGVVLSVEGGAAKAVVVAEDDGYDANLDEGEAIVYAPGKPTAQMRLKPDGSAAIATESGQDLTVQGGSLKVATDTTPTNNGTLSAVVAPAGPAYTVTITFTPPGGAPVPWLAFTVPAATPGTYNLSLTGKVNGGSTHFKAP